MTMYSMWNRTYRYFQGDPLYPFGFGLSYTTFQFSDLDLSPTRVKAGQNVTANFKITNAGPSAGTEVSNASCEKGPSDICKKCRPRPDAASPTPRLVRVFTC